MNKLIYEFINQIISMRYFCRALDNLGYTIQERRRIITGIINYPQYKDGIQ
jgi:hypothetical protein